MHYLFMKRKQLLSWKNESPRLLASCQLVSRQLNLFIYLHHATILLAHDVQPLLQVLYSVAVQVVHSCRHLCCR